MPYIYVEDKPEFPPLLEPGRWPRTIGELHALCVEPFRRSETRLEIMCCLEHVVSALAISGIKGDLWVDGSFLTIKDDPHDADLALCLQSDFAEAMTPEQREVIEWFQDDNEVIHRWLRCHCFAFVQWPREHDLYWAGEYDYVYWMKQWGFSRKNVLKGIAVIELR